MGISATVPPARGRAATRGDPIGQPTYSSIDAGAVASPAPASLPCPLPGHQATCAVHVSCTLARDDDRTPDIDLAALIADTEGEIVRLVRDRDPSTHGLYEMVRYHLALDGSGASAASGCGRCSACSPMPAITGEHQRALPGAAAVELGHNFSLVHDDIEDGDVERRHRPHAVDDPRRSAGDQHRRHAVQPVAGSPSTA